MSDKEAIAAAVPPPPPLLRKCVGTRQALWHYGQVSVNTVYYIIFVCIMHINIATVSHPSPAVILRQIQSFISTLLTSDECFRPSDDVRANIREWALSKLPFGFAVRPTVGPSPPSSNLRHFPSSSSCNNSLFCRRRSAHVTR